MNIQDYYKYSQFSALAYVEWRDISKTDFQEAISDANAASRIPGSVDPNNPVVDTLGERIFSPTTDGGQGWQVSDFHPNDPSGFKASLFTNSANGEKVLAICGTEPTSGLGVDLFSADLQEIGDLGMAISQAVDMYNYIQQLKAIAGSPVEQLEFVVSKNPPASGDYIKVGEVMPSYLSLVPKSTTATGLGLLKADDDVTITGHSLGGHLAAMGQRLFPDLFDNAVTYNAPGFDPAVGISVLPGEITFASLGEQLTDQFVHTLFAPHLNPKPLGFGNVQVMVSEDSVPGDDGSVVSSTLITGTQPAQQQIVTTEQNSHMIEPFVDSLAVQALLDRLKPNVDMTLAETGAILKAASAEPGKSEETILDALSELLLGPQSKHLVDNPNDVTDGFDAWIGPGDFTKRSTIHERIIALEQAIDATLGLTLESLVTTDTDGTVNALSASEIAALAQDNIAYRYALVNGLPFAVMGADYSDFNQNGELELTGDNGQLSEQYIADRSAYLSLRLAENINEFSTNPDNTQYIDEADGTIMQIGRYPDQVITFGNDDSNSELNGTTYDDHIYGMGGNDTLSGGTGNDLLDGGVGDDTYHIDTTSGSTVTTEDSQGNDTYTIHGAPGADVTITDSNGADTYRVYGGATVHLNGASTDDTLYLNSDTPVVTKLFEETAGQNVWTSEDGTITAIHHSQNGIQQIVRMAA
jgi:hypothetical protein